MTFHRGFHFVVCYMKYSQSVILSVACNTFGCNTFGLNSFLWGILEPIGFEKWTTPTARGTQLISGKTRNQSNTRKGNVNFVNNHVLPFSFRRKRSAILLYISRELIAVFVACQVSDLFVFHLCDGFLKGYFVHLPQHSHYLFVRPCERFGKML